MSATNTKLEDLTTVCGYLCSFLDKGRWEPSTALEELVLRTLARGRGTFETIVELAAAGRTLQAAMLGRSLFEDMVVAHWLVLHRHDPEWLLERFSAHADAMRLGEAEMREQMGWPSSDDVSHLRARRDELQKEFGKYAERDWWGEDRDGQRMAMPQLVSRLANERCFQPRLKGERPILEDYYSRQHKAWTQALHHTAVGTILHGVDDGTFPHSVAGASPVEILFGNYWVFGQLIFVALELAVAEAGVVAHFEKLFLAGIAVFAAALGITVPWADEVEAWAGELDGSTEES